MLAEPAEVNTDRRRSLGIRGTVLGFAPVLWLLITVIPFIYQAVTIVKFTADLPGPWTTATLYTIFVFATGGLILGLLGSLVLRKIFVALLVGTLTATIVLAAALGGIFPSVLAAGWILLLALGLGSWLLARIFERDGGPEGLERLIYATILGLGILSHLVLGISVSGLLYQGVIIAVMLVLTVTLSPTIAVTISHARASHRLTRITDSHPVKPSLVFSLLGIVAGSLFLTVVENLAPEIQFDSLSYHLGVPEVYLRAHQLIPTPYNVQSWFYLGTEMDYLLGMALAGGASAKLINLAYLLLTAGAMIALCRRLATTRAGFIAACLYLTSPLVAWEAASTYIDIAEACYCFLALAAWTYWRQYQSSRWLVVCGLASGFAISTKVNAAFIICPLALLTIGSVVRNNQKVPRQLLRASAPFIVALLGSGLEWPLLRFIQTGNPFFPMYNGYFRSPLWPPVNETFDFGNFGVGTGLTSLLQLPLFLTYQGQRFNEDIAVGTLGAAFIVWPLVLLVRRTPAWTVYFLGFSAFYGLAWAFTAQILRYLIPTLPVVSVIAGYALARISRTRWPYNASTASAVSVGIFMFGLVASSLPAFLAQYWNIPERIPYSVDLGTESRQHYLSRVLPEFDAYRMIERSKTGSIHILSATTSNEDRLYAPGVLEIIYSPQIRQILNSRIDLDVLNYLQQSRFTHIMISRSNFHPAWRNLVLLSDVFLTEHTYPVYAHDTVEAYRIAPDDGKLAALAELFGTNLLADPGFEQANEGRPIQWSPYGRPTLVLSKTRARTGIGAIRVPASAGYTQTVPVLPGSIYRLTHYSRADSPGSYARVQVNWLNQKGVLVGVGIYGYAVTRDWTKHELADTAPPRATQAQVYVVVDAGEVWFDDYTFQPISYFPLANSLSRARILPPRGHVPPISVRTVLIDGVQHAAVLEHPDGQITWTSVPVPETASLRFSTGIAPACQATSAGAEFDVEITFAGKTDVVFRRVMEPGVSTLDRLWRDSSVDLSPWRGKDVSLSFVTKAVNGNFTCAWALWGDPRVSIARANQ